MAAPFRIGLAGAGRMGRTHLRALADCESVRVVAVAEPAARVREGIAALGLPAYSSVAGMMDAGGLDGVLIAAPSDQHPVVVAEVAARGLPILCEKPCGLTSAQARHAAEAAAAAGVVLQVAYWRRYVSALRTLRERILDGSFGDVHLVCCYQWDERPPSREFRAHSGGIAIDMGVHEFDQLRWLTGQEFVTVAAASPPPVTGAGLPPDVDSAQILVRLSGGTVGFVSLGRFHPPGDMAGAEVFGAKCRARCDFLDPAQGERAQLEALRAQAEGFAAYAGGGKRTGASAADAVAALAAAEQANAAIPALAGAAARP